MTQDGEIEGLDDVQKRLDAIKNPRQALGRIGLIAVGYAKDLVPRKTGNLGRTIRLGQVTDSDVQILAGGQFGVGYAQAVEFGSKPHVIRPRNKRALRWSGNNRLSGNPKTGAAVTFSMYANHPGTQAKPFLRPAAERAVKESGLNELVIKPWNEAA